VIFFEFDVDTVAQALIGTFLFLIGEGDQPVGGKIVETEAYDQLDLAAHCYASAGKDPPESSKPMFFGGGHAYLYWANSLLCLNFVCGPKDFGSAVLIRAIEPTEGIETMFDRRKRYGPKILTERKLCSGPGVLCEALGISDAHYKRSLTGFSLFERPFDLRSRAEQPPTICGPRIGINKQMERAYPSEVAAHSPDVQQAIKRKRRWGWKESPFLSQRFKLSDSAD
jgi:DNA-3-methyladenine glycosylase